MKNEPVGIPRRAKIHVHLELPRGADLPEGGLVSVRILDVTRLDDDAIVVGETVLAAADVRAASEQGGYGVDVAYDDDAIDERNDYTVQVHVDRSGDGSLAVSDLITVQSVPVISRGAPTDSVAAPLHEISG